MKEKEIGILIQQRDQMLRLRNDSSIITGITFNTVAGDVTLAKKETALLLIDYLISDIQKQITYLSQKE